MTDNFDQIMGLPRVARYEPGEIREADHERIDREEDALQRRTLLAGRMGYDEINLAQAGQLGGDHYSLYGRGPICRLLIEEAGEGRLLLTSTLGRGRAGEGWTPQHPSRASVDKEAMRDWLTRCGGEFPRVRASALATWAGYRET